jgi:PX domain
LLPFVVRLYCLPSFVFLVQVADPQTVAGTFSSFTTYQISSTICPDGVRRRYSDFDWLREVLVARYHGIAVPLMPEKRLVGNQGKAFIEERMAGLENFILLLLANPYIRNDATLRMFMTQGGAAEFEQAKKATLQGVGADPSTNLGLGRWFGVLRHLVLPVDADAACRELSAHCAETEAKLVATLAACNRYYEAAKGLSESLKAVKDSLSDFHASANNSAAALSDSLAPLKVATTALGARLKRTADAFSNAHDLSVFSPNEIQIFLLDGLVSEIHRVRGLKALLEVREHAQKEYSNAWQAQDKLAFQEKGFREKGRADKADALAPKVAEAVAFMKRMKERLDDVSKGLLHIEAERLARTRVDRIVAMAGQFAALCIASGVRGQELWTAFLGGMELNQEAMVRDAQSTLTSLMSMHALDATGPAVAYVLPGTVVADAPPIVINSNGSAPVTATAGAGSASSSLSSGAGASAAAPGGEASSAVPSATFTGTATSGDVEKKEESVDL